MDTDRDKTVQIIRITSSHKDNDSSNILPFGRGTQHTNNNYHPQFCTEDLVVSDSSQLVRTQTIPTQTEICRMPVTSSLSHDRTSHCLFPKLSAEVLVPQIPSTSGFSIHMLTEAIAVDVSVSSSPSRSPHQKDKTFYTSIFLNLPGTPRGEHEAVLTDWRADEHRNIVLHRQQSIPAADTHFIKSGSAGNLLFLILLKKSFNLCFKLDFCLLP